MTFKRKKIIWDIRKSLPSIFMRRNSFEFFFMSSSGDHVFDNTEDDIDEVLYEMNRKNDKISLMIKDDNVDSLRALIASGVDIDTLDDKKNSPLTCAAMFQSPHCVKFLLESGAKISNKNVFGHTALDFAVCLSNLEIVKILIESRKSIAELVDDCSYLMRYCACTYMEEAHILNCCVDVQIAKYLVTETDLKSQVVKNESSFLHFAAKFDNSELADYLLKSGANVNAQDSDGNTPLHMAAMNDGIDAALLLIGVGADLKIQNSNRISPQDILDEKGMLVVSGQNV